jgi:hypothetical protein
VAAKVVTELLVQKPLATVALVEALKLSEELQPESAQPIKGMMVEQALKAQTFQLPIKLEAVVVHPQTP